MMVDVVELDAKEAGLTSERTAQSFGDLLELLAGPKLDERLRR